MKIPFFKPIPAGLYKKNALVAELRQDRKNELFLVETRGQAGERIVDAFPYNSVNILGSYSPSEALKAAIDLAETATVEISS